MKKLIILLSILTLLFVQGVLADDHCEGGRDYGATYSVEIDYTSIVSQKCDPGDEIIEVTSRNNPYDRYTLEFTCAESTNPAGVKPIFDSRYTETIVTPAPGNWACPFGFGLTGGSAGTYDNKHMKAMHCTKTTAGIDIDYTTGMLINLDDCDQPNCVGQIPDNYIAYGVQEKYRTQRVDVEDNSFWVVGIIPFCCAPIPFAFPVDGGTDVTVFAGDDRWSGIWVAEQITDSCREAKCGDGILNIATEQCDDGNQINGDGCDNDCTYPEPVCGNGYKDSSEECDDGANGDDTDGCFDDCTTSECGDGTVDQPNAWGEYEYCDDGNTEDGDGCDAECQVEVYCGDGVVNQPWEECDDGNQVDDDACSNECKDNTGCLEILKLAYDTEDERISPTPQFAFVRDSGAETVYTNSNGYAKFSNLLPGFHTVSEIVPSVGWELYAVTPPGGVVFVSAGSVCSTVEFKNKQRIEEPICGDGNVNQASEECELPDTINNEYCEQTTKQCRGNKLGVRDSYGNCDSECGCYEDPFDYQCVPGQCGATCSIDADCDDGDEYTIDSCNTKSCGCEYEQLPYCGDGIKESWEECDDGNNVDGDGCDADCEWEEGCIEVYKTTYDTNYDLITPVPQFAFYLNGNQDVAYTNSVGYAKFDNVQTGLNTVTEDLPFGWILQSIVPAGGNVVVSPGYECAQVYFTNKQIIDEPECGNGKVEDGEQCDDGNMNNNDLCRNDCKYNFCGDGYVDYQNEECDDGNNNNYDNCRNDCSLPYCGDGIKDAGEYCDDGNNVDGDGCSSECTREILEICGDGIVQDDEECDDGNNNNFDECRNDCTYSYCGDGIKDIGEECDDGNQIIGDGCSNECDKEEGCIYVLKEAFNEQHYLMDPVPPFTFYLNGGEQIAHSNPYGLAVFAHVQAGLNTVTENLPEGWELHSVTPPGGNVWVNNEDECVTVLFKNIKTIPEPECGNGVVEQGEQCDDGNSNDMDECKNNCEYNFCGDGIVYYGVEECDDGNVYNNDECRNDCTMPYCGDGVIDLGEYCDDGNNINGDGCSAQCEIEHQPVCGDGILEGDEECDDGNNVGGDGCSAVCTIEEPYCGDGLLEEDSEECDDGNNYNFDECRNDCTLPYCGDSVVDSDEECDDGNNYDGDGCSAFCEKEIIIVCGNGIVEDGELCDDGNNEAGDGCSCTCTPTYDCNDGVDNDQDGYIDFPEDPGCENEWDDEIGEPVCGDGIKASTEGCDDHNWIDGDGCSSECIVTTECNDKVDNDKDGKIDYPFDKGCTSYQDNDESNEAYCGDNHKDYDEECDDGNQVDGDGCSALCVIEEEQICSTPLDVILVNDRSGTMTGSRIAKAKVASTQFVNIMDPGQDKAGLVSFSWSATLDQELTFVHSDVIDAVNDLLAQGKTNIGAGIAVATEDILQNGRGETDVIIVLSDGKPNVWGVDTLVECDDLDPDADNDCTDYALDMAQDAKDAGITVYTIGLGVQGTYTEQLLKDIASTEGHYYEAATANVLDEIYMEVADAICPCGNDVLDDGEQCDDGNLQNGDGCSATCEYTTECSDGMDNDQDGYVDYPEDPGCTSLADNDESDEDVCSDGYKTGTEQCDDGNNEAGDGCHLCVVTTECADYVDNEFDGKIDLFDKACHYPLDDSEEGEAVCGNGIKEGDEECDDGNFICGDGCSPYCETTFECSDLIDNDQDGYADMDDYACENPEDDDEGNDPTCMDRLDNDGDGLIDMNDPECDYPEDTEYSVCGNNEVETGEECDDGNDQDGDGCSSVCLLTTQCNDGIDNDGDNVVDLADPGCTDELDNDESDGTTQCQDGLDNDQDGLTDMDDPGCTDPTDDDESDGTSQCQDGLDNDQDGVVDYPEDPGCESPQDNNEADATTQCQDGLDNDQDGLTDMDDPGCTDPTDDDESDGTSQCQDGLDNDQDGLVDYPEDLGCTDALDNDESQDPVCYDGIDNDDDGMADEMDPGCWDDPEDSSTYNPRDDDESDATTMCQDGLDNDGDGLVDLDDPGCENRIDNDEYNKYTESESDLYITNIRFVNGYFTLTMENNGRVKMDDLSVRVTFLELGEYYYIGKADLKRNGRVTLSRALDIPSWIEPGVYDARITVSNDNIRRVVHRGVDIE